MRERCLAAMGDKRRIYLLSRPIALGVPLYAVVSAARDSFDGAIGRVGGSGKSGREVVNRLVMAVCGRDGIACFEAEEIFLKGHWLNFGRRADTMAQRAGAFSRQILAECAAVMDIQQL